MENHDKLAGYPPALLEDWYRFNYFNNEIDISGSGVQDYTFAETRQMAGITIEDLDALVMNDSPTPGRDSLRQVVADRFGDGDASKVFVANGSNEALQLVICSIVGPDDEIITLEPCYHCHDKIAASMGCKTKTWKLSFDNDFAVDFADLQAMISDKTKALVVNFPHNPTGMSINQQQLDQIVELAREKGLYLVWDAAFQEMVYDSEPLKDPLFVYDKTISVGTFSKAYGLPGLRFGWFIAPPEVVAGSLRQKDYGNLYVAPLLELVSQKVIENLDKFAVPRMEQATINRDLVDQWVQQNSEFVSWVKPQGGVCGLIKLPQGCNDELFCRTLLEKQQVLLVPGSCFGCPGYARLGFGGETEKLKIGLERLTIALKEAA